MAVIISVNVIEINSNGVITINLSASASNDDWLRSAKLLKEGRNSKFKKIDNAHMYVEIE